MACHLVGDYHWVLCHVGRRAECLEDHRVLCLGDRRAECLEDHRVLCLGDRRAEYLEGRLELCLVDHRGRPAACHLVLCLADQWVPEARRGVQCLPDQWAVCIAARLSVWVNRKDFLREWCHGALPGCSRQDSNPARCSTRSNSQRKEKSPGILPTTPFTSTTSMKS